MTVWIFNHYAQPDTLPGGTRHFDLARALVQAGHRVTLFAAGYHYTLLREVPSYGQKAYKAERIQDVDFIWVKTFPYRKNDYRRMLNLLSYAWRLRWVVPKLHLSPPDIVVGSTVHPFAPLIASFFAKRYGVPFVFEIRDLWPQTFIDMNVWKASGWQSKLFSAIERFTVARAERIVVLSPLTAEYLKQRYGYDDAKMLLLPNGVAERFLCEPSTQTPDGFHIVYVGGIDRVHGLEFLLETAKRLLERPEIVFDIYGDGKERARLQARCEREDIANIRWHGSVKKSEVPVTLATADALFVSTANVLYGSENKLYEYMASAKPLIVATLGEHNNPAASVGCGISVDRDDSADAARKIADLADAPQNLRWQMGANGVAYVKKNRMVSGLAQKLERFLRTAVDAEISAGKSKDNTI